MTLLSVNVNKIATLRNSRGGNYPDILKFAKKIKPGDVVFFFGRFPCSKI